MNSTHEHTPVVFEFDRYRFFPAERRLLQDAGKQLWLDPKPNALLKVLVKDSGKLITYEELKREVWPELQHIADRTLHQHKYALSATLGKNSEGKDYIETVSGQGYRFAMNVIAHDETNSEPNTAQPAITEATNFDAPIETNTSRSNTLFGGHELHVFVSCFLYALLYAIALFIEVAYQYESFASSVWVIAFVVLLWTLGTSLIGLRVDWQRTARGKKTGLLLSLHIFIASGLLVYLALGYYLPNQPITESRLQTYPAHGAYLKSVYYHLPLAAICLVLPFHFVISLKRDIQNDNRLVKNLLLGRRRATAPAGAIFVRPWMLGALLFGAAIYALAATNHLFDNLIPGSYTNVFIQLVQLRLLLYFALGLECLLWYSWSLNEIKRELIETSSS